MKKYWQLFRRELALALILLIALSGMCAQAATGVRGSGSFPGDLYEEEYELLALGSSGEAVEALQERLIELGYLSGKADGNYGPKTEQAVEAFQREAEMEETGEADPETQQVLFDEDAPEASFAVEQEYASKSGASSGSGQMVWIPNSGHRYHSNSSCSNMKNPRKVTIEEAIRLGFTPCKRCYG